MPSFRPLQALFRTVAALSIAVLFAAIPSHAQTTPDLEQGMKPYGSFQSGSIDAVSMTSGNLALNVPLWSITQRGGKLQMGLSLYYTGSNFYAQTTCTKYGNNNRCQIYTTQVYPNALGVGFIDPQRIGIHAGWVDSEQQDDQGNEIFMPSYSIVTSDGATHQLGVSTASRTSFESIDGTGFHYDSSTGFVTSPNGIRSYVGPETFQDCLQSPTSDRCSTGDPFSVTWASSWEDSNGNKISLSPSAIYTDTLGRTIPESTASTSTSSCPQLNYPYQSLSSATIEYLPAPGGGTAPYTLCYASVHVRTDFFGGALYDVEYSQTVYMLQSIILPNGNAWSFEYDAADPNNNASIGYGSLVKVSFPTGGSISYSWQNSSYVCTFGSTQVADLPQFFAHEIIRRFPHRRAGFDL